MQFEVRSKAASIILGFLVLLMGAFFLILGIVLGINKIVLGDHKAGISFIFMSFFFFLFMGTIGLIGLWGWLRIRTLRVIDDSIQLVIKEHVVGQVPFSNVEMIRGLWKRDLGPSGPGLAGGMLGGAIGGAVGSMLESNQEKSQGVVIVVKDPSDPSTYWPWYRFKKRRRQIWIKGDWQIPFNKIVENLRDQEMNYLRSHGLRPAETEDDNPFKFN